MEEALGVSWAYGGYSDRGQGSLRAMGSLGQPVVYGYVMAVTIGLFLYLRKSVAKTAWHLGLALLITGLIASLSRGPWVGAIALLLIFIATGPFPAKGFLKLGLFGVVIVPLLLVTPAGQSIIDLLPFIGTVQADNVAYRQQFTEISIRFILEHPWFGAYDYLYAPEMDVLKPQGLLDTLNVFLTVGLGSGLIGMSIFSGAFIVAAIETFRAMRNQADRNGELYLLGQALLSTLLCIVVTNCTISGILIIPVIYWSVIGLCVAYARMLARAEIPAKTSEAAKPPRFQPMVIQNR